jgi:hypothetical protein
LVRTSPRPLASVIKLPVGCEPAQVMVKAVQGRPIILSAARPFSTPYIAALKRSPDHLPRGPIADTAHRQRVP